MTMHVPALHAPPIPHETGVDAAVAAAERRRQFIESLLTAIVTVLVVTAVSAIGVALELN